MAKRRIIAVEGHDASMKAGVASLHNGMDSKRHAMKRPDAGDLQALAARRQYPVFAGGLRMHDGDIGIWGRNPC